MEATIRHQGIWSRLAAEYPGAAICWRQDGRVVARDGKLFARFVAYLEANSVRERLDAVVPGEWDLTLELLPPLPASVGGAHDDLTCSLKARLQILGVIREDVGSGRDYKAAATDAFKRAAARFGIAHELHAYDENWVQMDGDGRDARPVESPAIVFARKRGPSPVAGESAAIATPANATMMYVPENGEALPQSDSGDVECPKCGGRMWDNRQSKRNPKAPDFRCRDRSCDGVIWRDSQLARP